MQEANKQQWANQTFANRVSISKNPGKLKVIIKAEDFFLSNNILTLTLSTLIICDILLAYLFAAGMIPFNSITVSITAASMLVSFGLIRAWVWHNLGEENIEINGGQLSVSRNYAVYNTKPNIIKLGKSTDLFTNRLDTWSWSKMQNKGILRVWDHEKSLDFGIQLNEQEYEMLVIPIGNQIKQFKAVAAQVTKAAEVDSSLQSIVEDADKPNLEKQQDGQHRKVLDDYHKKVVGASEDILDKIEENEEDKEA